MYKQRYCYVLVHRPVLQAVTDELLFYADFMKTTFCLSLYNSLVFLDRKLITKSLSLPMRTATSMVIWCNLFWPLRESFRFEGSCEQTKSRNKQNVATNDTILPAIVSTGLLLDTSTYCTVRPEM